MARSSASFKLGWVRASVRKRCSNALLREGGEGERGHNSHFMCTKFHGTLVLQIS